MLSGASRAVFEYAVAVGFRVRLRRQSCFVVKGMKRRSIFLCLLLRWRNREKPPLLVASEDDTDMMSVLGREGALQQH